MTYSDWSSVKKKDIDRLLDDHVQSLWPPGMKDRADEHLTAMTAEQEQEADEDIEFANQYLAFRRLDSNEGPKEEMGAMAMSSNYEPTSRKLRKNPVNASPVVARLSFATSLLIGFGALAAAALITGAIYLVATGQTVDVDLIERTPAVTTGGS